MMDIKHQFTRKSRVVEQTYDTKIAAQMANDNEGVSMVPDTMDYPIYLIVKVQVRVLFFWITIWEMQCDISDGDTRQHIINKASVLCEYLTKDHWNARAKTKEGQNNEK